MGFRGVGLGFFKFRISGLEFRVSRLGSWSSGFLELGVLRLPGLRSVQFFGSLRSQKVWELKGFGPIA